MKVEVTEQVVVVARPGYHLTYDPQICTAPRAHIEEIERQGKGRRLADGAEEAPPESDAEKA